jgi:hypothetical protein
VLGPDGVSLFDELRRREAAQGAIRYAFDVIEHDGEDLRNLPFLDRKAALTRLLRDAEAGILLNEHIAEDGATVFAHACRLGAEGIVSKKVDLIVPTSQARAGSGSRSAIALASPCSRSGARSGIDEHRRALAAKAKSPGRARQSEDQRPDRIEREPRYPGRSGFVSDLTGGPAVCVVPTSRKAVEVVRILDQERRPPGDRKPLSGGALYSLPARRLAPWHLRTCPCCCQEREHGGRVEEERGTPP